MFGSVTSDIAKVISAEGINVDKGKSSWKNISNRLAVILQVKFHPEVAAAININVEALE